MVIGSGFGIFFAAESAGDGMSLADAITQLNGEYQDRLEEIEADHPHDRLEITSNDGSYAIAWQDVLAVFAARTSGAEGRRAGGISGRSQPGAAAADHVGYE